MARTLPVAAAFVAAIVAGCSVLAPPDARLCSAAQNLTAAMTLTTTAIAADGAGDLARAQGLATQARSLAELAHDTLQQVPDDKQADTVWQALLDVYLHAAQGANSLLPAYSSAHGTGADELARATASMGAVRSGLPSMCFAIPSGLETPASS